VQKTRTSARSFRTQQRVHLPPAPRPPFRARTSRAVLARSRLREASE